ISATFSGLASPRLLASALIIRWKSLGAFPKRKPGWIWMKTKRTFIVLCPEGHALLPISSLLGVVRKFENVVDSLKDTFGDIRLADLPQEEILGMLSFTEKLDKSLRS